MRRELGLRGGAGGIGRAWGWNCKRRGGFAKVVTWELMQSVGGFCGEMMWGHILGLMGKAMAGFITICEGDSKRCWDFLVR